MTSREVPLTKHRANVSGFPEGGGFEAKVDFDGRAASLLNAISRGAERTGVFLRTMLRQFRDGFGSRRKRAMAEFDAGQVTLRGPKLRVASRQAWTLTP